MGEWTKKWPSIHELPRESDGTEDPCVYRSEFNMVEMEQEEYAEVRTMMNARPQIEALMEANEVYAVEKTYQNWQILLDCISALHKALVGETS